MSELNSQVLSATKWSSITEIAAKLVTPLTTMVLARLLTPDAFGVLVTATMVISFAEIFTDAGFQKYLIQHQFKSDDDLNKSTTVAFWSNLVLSLVIWLVIICFSQEIAKLVGNEGRGDVIAISCACIPLAAFSSIQMALYKRKLDFKTLFIVRIIGVLVPIVITIPLAIVTRTYWSLIIGMIAQNFSNALILTIKSTWKPNFFYSFALLKEMFSFTVWSMIEAVSIWLTGYVDIFIVGTMLNQHYLGLYRTSMSTVGQIMGLITSATTPVLFSSLSKLQDNEEDFKKMFFNFQKIVGMLVIPIGVGIYLFSDLVTKILLGSQWMETSHFIGIWGLISSVTVVLSQYASEIYRAKGMPKISVLSQVLFLIFLIPTVLWSVTKGFDFLCDMRALVRLVAILINAVLLYIVVHIKFGTMLFNILPSIISSVIMGLVILIMVKIWGRTMLLEFIYILVAIIVYGITIILFPSEREIILKAINNIIHIK